MGRVMPKILVLLSILFIPTIAGMAPAEPASASNFTLSGIYDVFQLDKPALRVTGFFIRSSGQHFSISGIGQSWMGQGKADGQSGCYDWQFADGRAGRTDFRINPDGSLQGHAVGPGVDFSFVARRTQLPVQNFVRQRSLQQPQPVATTKTCESQANQCQQCQNGRYRGTGFLCQYGSLPECRSSILQFCKESPSSDKELVVKGGRLTNNQAYELMMSCPNIPHGSIPYSGTAPAPGSKKMQQCQAFEKTYFACNLLFRSFDKTVAENRGKCLRETYTGP
jgi:hypothetical protein